MVKLLYMAAALVCLFGLIRLMDEYEKARIDAILGTPLDIDPKTLIENRQPLIGSANSKIKFIEFMDYECEPCRRDWRTIRTIASGKERALYVRHFPIRSIHKLAENASLAALSTDTSSRRDVHEKLIGSPLSRELINQILSGLPPASLQIAKAQLKEDESLAQTIGISYTPTLYAIYEGKVYEIRDRTALKGL